jgi:hypothetical protein
VTCTEEIDYFIERATIINDYLNRSNAQNNSNIKITAIMIDSERFKRSANQVRNAAIQEKLNTIHLLAKSFFPDATIIWFGRGKIQYTLTGRWADTPWWTGTEITEVLTCSLYTPIHREQMAETIIRTGELGATMNIDQVVPYIALNSGYDEDRNWIKNWQYPIEDSEALGRTVEESDYVKEAIFYPPPFNDNYPDWTRHFLAYCLGFNNGPSE